MLQNGGQKLALFHIYELYIEDGKLVVEVAPVQKQKGGRDVEGLP